MDAKFKPDWLDAFMLLWGIAPFVAMGYGFQAAAAFPFLRAVLYLAFVPCCIGFPAASILYFIWRFNRDRTQSTTKSQTVS
jgi:hypothetical protein